MGIKRLGEIATGLIEAGRSPDEPAAVIERGTQPGQRVAEAPLSEIASAASEAESGRPP